MRAMSGNIGGATATRPSIWLAAIFLCIGLLLAGCANNNGFDAQDSAGSATDGKAEPQSAAASEDLVSNAWDVRKWNVTLPDDSWQMKHSGSDCLDLYKDGYHDYLNASISVYLNNMNAEDSLQGSKGYSNNMGADVKDIYYEVNGVSCLAIEKYQKEYDKTVVQVYYPLNSEKSLQINMFVKKGGTQGVDPDSEEVKQIIQSIVDENGLLEAASLGGEAAEKESITITADGLSFEGKLFASEDFTVVVPDGWESFETSYGTVYVIKGGETIEDYKSKPFVRMRFSDDDARTSFVMAKKYIDAVDLIVDVCGTKCNALRYREELVSKQMYWDCLEVFMPVSGSKCIRFAIAVDSSEFEGLDVTDDDVRQIIISTQRSFAN